LGNKFFGKTQSRQVKDEMTLEEENDEIYKMAMEDYKNGVNIFSMDDFKNLMKKR
jgi:hypothetical protein